VFYNRRFRPNSNKKPAIWNGGLRKLNKKNPVALFLPGAFLVAIRFEALAAFVFRHLQTSFLFEISHGVKRLMKGQRATGPPWCKA